MQDISQKNLTNTAMKGSLDDLPLPDLVQLFMNNLRSGDLRIYSDGKEGHVFFHDGRVEFASIEGIVHLPPRKAFCRIVGWTIGNFEMFPLPDNPEFTELIVESTESLLADAVRHGDEVQSLQRGLPNFQETLIIPRPLRALDSHDLSQRNSIPSSFSSTTVQFRTHSTTATSLTTRCSTISHGSQARVIWRRAPRPGVNLIQCAKRVRDVLCAHKSKIDLNIVR